MDRKWKKLSAVSLVVLSLVAWGCAEQGANLLEPSTEVLGKGTTPTPTTSTTVTTLLRNTPLAENVTRSWVITSNGANLDWPEMGLKVNVPNKAISTPSMTITITALKGDVLAYDFGPDGTRFAQPLEIVQDLKYTNFYKLSTAPMLRGAYFKSATLVDDASNTAVVEEFQAADSDQSNSQVKFKIKHFSGYLLATN